MAEAGTKRRPNALRVLRDNVAEKEKAVVTIAVAWHKASPEPDSESESSPYSRLAQSLTWAVESLVEARALLARAEGRMTALVAASVASPTTEERV